MLAFIAMMLSTGLGVDFFFWRKRRKALHGLGVFDTTQALGSSKVLGSSQALGSSLIQGRSRGFDRIYSKQFKKNYLNVQRCLNAEGDKGDEQ